MDNELSPEEVLSLAGGEFDEGPRTGRPNTGDNAAEAPGWQTIDPCNLQGKPIPERKFIVHGWLGQGHVSANFGDGGVGKTLLAQQLMTSTATGRPWCGLAVTRCRSIGLFCEDDPSELHRRQEAINRGYGVHFSDLRDARWISGVGHDNTLVTFDTNGHGNPTPAFDRLMREAKEFEAELVVIDTAADTFGGNENARREVRQFIGAALGRLAKELDAAVLLNCHPSRTGLGVNGDLDGGSTAWNNTVRARWSLGRPKPEDGEADPDARILTRRKANYAAAGDTIKMRWENGVLVPVNRPTGFAAAGAAIEADTVFLALLAKVGTEGRPVSDSPNASNAAPKVFARHPDRAGLTRADFEAAMQRLFAAGKIRMAEYGRTGSNGKPRRIVSTEATTDA